MIQKHRISTNIGRDQKIMVELKQDYDLLEILSLKFTQKEVYTSNCADYGVVCGRISVNNGLGIPNARVSIFVPLLTEHENDPVISALYPYKTTDQKDDNNYRYNLLPSRKQHGGHEPTGTFPDQLDILSREEILEVFENYYRYTVKTNESGDFMIWGVPIGQQTIHVDVDLSDIGCFSLRPYDFIRQGVGVDAFKNSYTYKASVDIDSLPQIVSFDKTIEVYPFWGNKDLCELGISRVDFDLANQGIKIEPKAFMIGGTYTDTGKNSVNKNCDIRSKLGRKCDLHTTTGIIEAIRFTPEKDEQNRPILERYELHEDIPDDGSFVLPLPMNMDYLFTNEFGENEITNDPNKGIPTSACYRFRFSLNDNGNSRTRKTASYLVPNIREYSDDSDKSYSFSTNLDDYPTASVDSLILNSTFGEYYPQDYFYRFNYNKVYTISSFQNLYYKGDGTFNKDKFIGIKDISPSEEEDCSSNVVTPPVNFGVKNYSFTLLIADVLLFLEQLFNMVILLFLNTLSRTFHNIGNSMPNVFGLRRIFHKIGYSIQNSGQKELRLINYPECEECNSDEFGSGSGDIVTKNFCQVGTLDVIGNNSPTTASITTSTPSTTWTLVHNLGEQYPTVQVFDSNDLLIQPGNISFVDVNTLIVSFSSAQIGKATATVRDPISRRKIVNNIIYSLPGSGICAGASGIINDADFVNRQTDYYLKVDNVLHVLESPTTGVSYFKIENGNLVFFDGFSIFMLNQTYNVYILDKNLSDDPIIPIVTLESGCELYDTPYNELLVSWYYMCDYNTNPTRCPSLTSGPNVVACELSDGGTSLESEYYGDVYDPKTLSHNSEFSNGVFYIIPGTQSNTHLIKILKEYRRRKRVGKMFCGGIVNYSFIDNWLSGSLYFFLFKGKNGKYCNEIIKHIDSEDKYYYKSTTYTSGTWGVTKTNSKILGRPTTIVDLGPRDEFIKEICVDESLDPNCSVARSIGPSTFKSFGEILGMGINYRMDVSNNEYSLDSFFSNSGFTFTNKVFAGDLLQLISINNEAGIEEFDLQHPKYLGYNYQILDPEIYPNVFQKSGYWGPLPVTFVLDEDGQRIRQCINEPTHIDYSGNTVQGRLTESSQNVPFFLWDKKGTGFGGTSESTSNLQSWDYSTTQLQPLQGMTYGYNITGGTNDSSDKYLLLPITNTFTGLTISANVTTDVHYDVISITDGHSNHNTEYPGFTYLYVTSGTTTTPLSGTIYVRYGTAGTWWTKPWDYTMDFIIPRSEDYYSGNKQILSTPFMFYFGLRPGKTGLNKFIDLFGPKGAFPTTE